MVLKSRRFKEVTVMVLCVASAMRAWFDLATPSNMITWTRAR